MRTAYNENCTIDTIPLSLFLPYNSQSVNVEQTHLFGGPAFCFNQKGALFTTSIKDITTAAVAQIRFAKLGLRAGQLTELTDESITSYADYIANHFNNISYRIPNRNPDDLKIGLLAAYSIQKWTQGKAVYEFDQVFLRQLLQANNFKVYQKLLRNIPTTDFVMPLPETMTFYAMYVHVEFLEENTVIAVCPFTDTEAAQYAAICKDGKVFDSKTDIANWSKDEREETVKKQAQDILKLAVSACYYLVATNSAFQKISIPKDQRVAIKRNGKTQKFITMNYRVGYGENLNPEKPLCWQHFRTGKDRSVLEVRLLNGKENQQ